MFNLEQEILEWRRKMLAAGIKTPVPLDELESHLRDEIEQQTKSGFNEPEAFNRAVQKIGQAHALEHEFKKVRGTKGNTMNTHGKILPFLLLAWNTTIGLYFLPGQPSLCLLLILASFAVAMIALFKDPDAKFISVPSVTLPLLFLTAVVLGTAMLTGGIGVPGTGTIGGHRYLMLLAAVLGYFALIAQRIPLQKANQYVKLFFLGALSAAVASVAFTISPDVYSRFFPAEMNMLNGVAYASIAIIALLFSIYGLRGVLAPAKYWRFVAFALLVILSFLGGYQALVLDLALLCCLMFFLEGLFRTRLLPTLLVAAVLTGSLVIPLANKLPHPIQRSLAFLPLHLDQADTNYAKATAEWRVNVWKTVLPQVPHHLVLGKGLGLDAHDLEVSRGADTQNKNTPAQVVATGDFHSGPLSLVLPFGIPGVIGFVWFLVAGGRVLYRNYKLGDPELLQINRCLFGLFITRAVMFVFIFGSFYSDMIYFVGLVGLSIALNGGARNANEEVSAPQPVPLNNLKLANG